LAVPLGRLALAGLLPAVGVWLARSAQGPGEMWAAGGAFIGGLIGGILLFKVARDEANAREAEMAEEGERQQRKAETAERAVASLLDGLPDPALLLGPGRTILRANRAGLNELGEAAVGRDLAAVLRHPAVLEAADAVLGGEAQRDAEFVEAGATPRHLVARVRALPDPTAEGGVAVLALGDITPLRRAERLRADFVANASHEIRTPLATLSGCIETLRGPARDDPQAQGKFLALMAEQSGRMTRLVQDLLSLSRIELDEATPPTEPVTLGPLLERVRDALAIPAEERKTNVNLTIAAPLPEVNGEMAELEQVFHNLIDNAIKYGGGEVSIEARAKDRWVVVRVADNGAGIAREHIPRLTERFYRVDAARSRALGGTGLGLAIVKHIVNRHDGKLSIDSRPGEGTSFTVELPARP
jgi:two-component system, OmpR family, phosphate regulon sensor histidine kinase PhoR